MVVIPSFKHAYSFQKEKSDDSYKSLYLKLEQTHHTRDHETVFDCKNVQKNTKGREFASLLIPFIKTTFVLKVGYCYFGVLVKVEC